MLWRIENKHSAAGRQLAGSFDHAVLEAQGECTTDTARWVVWMLPSNIRVAEVSIRGCLWTKSELSGQEVTTLMRRHKKTIEQLAFRLDITQKCVRQARERGLLDPYAVRDWIEAITGEDIGPLPEPHVIQHIMEETSCAQCGFPLDIRDQAFDYIGDLFCSITCCRKSRGWTTERVT